MFARVAYAVARWLRDRGYVAQRRPMRGLVHFDTVVVNAGLSPRPDDGSAAAVQACCERCGAMFQVELIEWSGTMSALALLDHARLHEPSIPPVDNWWPRPIVPIAGGAS
jgi:hypothetical protein